MPSTLSRKGFTPAPTATPPRSVKLTAEGIVVAIVAVTGVTDAVNDLIVPGAFQATLAKRRPKVVDDHEWKNKRGRTLHSEEWLPGDARLPKKTQSGADWPAEAGALVATMQYNMDTPEGLNAWKWVKFYAESNEAEFSIGYTVPDAMARKRTDGVRVILMVELFEYSHVLFGANSLTMALEVKSAMHAGSAGTVTAPSLAPAKRVPDEDDNKPTPPLPLDEAWDDDETPTNRKRATMEAKTAAAVLNAALAPEFSDMETKQFSKMKGSYEERMEAINNACRDLFSAIMSCPADDVWAYAVATYPTEVVVQVHNTRSGDAGGTYLVGYSIPEGTLDVELAQPEKVTLSLVAEPENGDEPAPVTDEVVVDAATVFIPHLEAFAARHGIEKKTAQSAYTAFLTAIEGKGAPEPAYESDATPVDAPAHDGPSYDKDNLPEGEWGTYRKATPVKCMPMVGKYKVHTQEGPVDAEDGWMALDNGGHPYPIADKEFDTAYVPDGDDDETPSEAPAEAAEEPPAGDDAPSADAPADEPDAAPTDAESVPVNEDDLEHKTDPKGEFEGKDDVVTLDPDQHFSMREQLQTGLDSQLEDRDKNN